MFDSDYLGVRDEFDLMMDYPNDGYGLAEHNGPIMIITTPDNLAKIMSLYHQPKEVFHYSIVKF